MIKVEVLKCFKQDNRIYGEFYVHLGDVRELVIQNGVDIVIIPHVLGAEVKDCIKQPSRKVREAIANAAEEYLVNIKKLKEKINE